MPYVAAEAARRQQLQQQQQSDSKADTLPEAADASWRVGQPRSDAQQQRQQPASPATAAQGQQQRRTRDHYDEDDSHRERRDRSGTDGGAAGAGAAGRAGGRKGDGAGAAAGASASTSSILDFSQQLELLRHRRAHPGLRWSFRYAAGRVFPAASLHGLVTHAFYNPGGLALLTALCRGEGACVRHMRIPGPVMAELQALRQRRAAMRRALLGCTPADAAAVMQTAGVGGGSNSSVTAAAMGCLPTGATGGRAPAADAPVGPCAAQTADAPVVIQVPPVPVPAAAAQAEATRTSTATAAGGTTESGSVPTIAPLQLPSYLRTTSELLELEAASAAVASGSSAADARRPRGNAALAQQAASHAAASTGRGAQQTSSHAATATSTARGPQAQISDEHGPDTSGIGDGICAFSTLFMLLLLQYGVVSLGLFRSPRWLSSPLPYVQTGPPLLSRVRPGDVVFVLVPVGGTVHEDIAQALL